MIPIHEIENELLGLKGFLEEKAFLDSCGFYGHSLKAVNKMIPYFSKIAGDGPSDPGEKNAIERETMDSVARWRNGTDPGILESVSYCGMIYDRLGQDV